MQLTKAMTKGTLLATYHPQISQTIKYCRKFLYLMEDFFWSKFCIQSSFELSITSLQVMEALYSSIFVHAHDYDYIEQS